MKVSVVIPVYNSLVPLKLVVHGFNLQTIDKNDFEVIIVDDGSHQKVQLDKAEYDFQLKVIHQQNKGRSAARNTGIEAAEGKIILMNDADRIPTPDFIKVHTSYHENHEHAVVVGNPKELYVSDVEKREAEIKKIIENGRITRFVRDYAYANVVGKVFNADGSTASKIPWMSFFSGNASVKKENLTKVGFFDTRFKKWGLEHFELGYRLFNAGYPFFRAVDAINQHIVHARENNFYLTHFNESVELFAEISQDSRVESIYSFLAGELSLQALEQVFAGDTQIYSDESEIYFKLGNSNI